MSSRASEAVASLRTDITHGKFGCLWSFLERLCSTTWSMSAAVVRIDLGASRAVVEAEHRLEGSGVGRYLGQMVDELPARVRASSQFNVLPVTDDATGEVYRLALARTGRVDRWRPTRGERYFVCLMDSRLLPLEADPPAEAAIEVAHVTGEWFRWARDRRELRSAVVGDVAGRVDAQGDETTHRALGQELEAALEDTSVRPIHERELVAVLREMPPELPHAERIGLIERLSDIAVGPRCRCPDRPTDGCLACDGDATDLSDRLHVLRGLAYWSVDWWKDNARSDKAASRQRDRWRKTAIDALSASVPLLDARVDLRDAGERELLCHFMARAIEHLDARLRKVWQSRRVRSSALQTPASLAALVTMLLTDEAWTVDTIDALVHVVAEYGYHELDVPRRLRIESHLRQTMRGEPALHALKPYYRDHFFHAIEVCLMGFALLDSHVTTTTTFAQRIGQRCVGAHGATEPEVLKRLWWVASLTHDAGYGMDILAGALSLLSFFEGDERIAPFAADVRRALVALPVDDKLLPELTDDANRARDHGVVTASHLHAVLRRMSPTRQGDLAAAVRAVAFHNSRAAAVKAYDDPIAALLIICDSLQEWRRAHLGFGQAPAIMLSRVVGSPQPLEQAAADAAMGPVERFRFSMKEPPANMGGVVQHIWTDSDCLTARLTYGSDINKNSGVFFLWMDATYNLQRVDIAAFGPSIRVQYVTPSLDDGISQLDRLEDCLQEVGMPFIEAWVTDARRKRKDWDGRIVHHEVRDGKEILTLDLKLLGARHGDEPLLGGSIGDFYTRLRAWSGYFDDRDLVEDPMNDRVV